MRMYEARTGDSTMTVDLDEGAYCPNVEGMVCPKLQHLEGLEAESVGDTDELDDLDYDAAFTADDEARIADLRTVHLSRATRVGEQCRLLAGRVCPIK